MNDADARPVLVTGATGFLGRAVVRRLRRAGVPVRAAGGPTASLHVVDLALDLRSEAQITAAVRDTAAVIHLAAVGGPQSMHDTVLTTDVNALGTQRLARAARQAGVPRLLYASTHAVYADVPGRLEERATLGPRGVYAAAKLSGEWLAAAECAGSLTLCTAARLFNLYGADAPAENIVSRFSAMIATGETIRLSAPAGRAIDLLHVDDAATVIIALLVAPKLPPVVNVGTGTATSLDALARQIAMHLDRPALLEVIDVPGAYAHDRVAAVELLTAVLPAFAPRTLQYGLDHLRARHAA